MDCFGIWSVCCLLVASFAIMVGGQAESRGWTPPFTQWMTTSTMSTVRATKSHSTVPTSTTSSPINSVCDRNCCKCDGSKTRVECTSSHHCNEFILNTTTRLPKEARTVIFTGFLRLKINKGSLNFPQNLTTFYIERVDKIEAESYALSQPACNERSPRMRSSFARPSLVINGSGSIIFERRAFTGAWSEILIINSKVKVMESEMFYNTSCLKKFTLEGNFIEEIKFKTLADGETQYLSIKSNTIQSIEHGAFQLSVTDSAHISSNRINVIQSEAFVLRTPRTFSFINNTVGNVFSYAFQLAATESIDIKLSAFDSIARHAFRKIETVGNAKMAMALSIKKFDKGALDLDQSLFQKSSLQFFEIQLDRDCDCELRVVVDTLFSPTLRRNASSKDDFNSVLRDFIFCRVRNESKKFYEFASSHHCQAPDVIMLVSITCAILAILLLMAVAVTIIFRQKAKLRRRTSVETSNGWVMHIYTETECQVKEEFTVPLESVGENGPEHDLLLLTANQNEVCQDRLSRHSSGLPTYQQAACSLSKESANYIHFGSNNCLS